jgi:small subunit ribosomal protein S1
MKELLEKETFKPLQPGKIIKGKVLAKGKRELLVDISPWGTGKVYGGEFLKAKEKLKSIKEGDEIWAKIVDVDNEDNFVELSLSEVMEELKLNELREKKEKGEKIVVQIFGANKGGLLTQIEGFPAFLPISQMEEKIVQELQDEEKSNVLKKLRQFVGKRIEVKILTILNPQRQIILTQ